MTGYLKEPTKLSVALYNRDAVFSPCCFHIFTCSRTEHDKAKTTKAD